jgi:uncharacterized membrane protein YkvA (DUF1232 family)
MKFSLESLYGWYRQMLNHPRYRWWIVLGSLVYLLSPIDFLPDVFPVLGWIDDGLIATLLVSEISQMVLTGLKNKAVKQEKDSPQEPMVVDVVGQDVAHS